MSQTLNATTRLEELANKNRSVNLEQIQKALDLVEELKKEGITGASYDIESQYKHGHMISKSSLDK